VKILNKRTIGILATTICLLIIAVNAIAITITVSRSYKIGREAVREGTIDFDSSYTSVTGESVTASDFKLNTIRWMELRNTKSGDGNLKTFEFNDTSSIIRVYEASGIEETGDISDLTGVKFKVFGY